MTEEKNDIVPNDEPEPATPDTLEKGVDMEEEEPQSATQDIMELAEEPPKAKPDYIMKMLTPTGLKRLFRKEEKKKK